MDICPPKEAEVTPWKHVNIDIIEPYTISHIVNDPKGKKHKELRALIMIDPVVHFPFLNITLFLSIFQVEVCKDIIHLQHNLLQHICLKIIFVLE